MNVKTIILSEEEFNNLKNANTLEQLLDFKNNIINQGSSNNIQTNNNNLVQNDIDKYIGIRILSKDEFNRYVKNGTADGSISSCNINVWHYSTPLSVYANVQGDNTGRFDYMKTWANNADTSAIINKQYLRYALSSEGWRHAGGNGWCTWDYRAYTNHYAELSQHNVNNNLIHCSINGLFELLSVEGNRMRYYNSTDLTYYTSQKNIDVITINLQTQDSFAGGGIMYMNITVCPSFRPVFIIKDDEKSKNTYY